MSVESIPSVVKNDIRPPSDNVPPEDPANLKEKRAEQQENSPDLSQMEKAVINIQDKMKVFHNVNLDFDVHQASGQIMVTVTEKDTGKLIREIPPREMLNLTAKLEEMIGIIFDQQI